MVFGGVVSRDGLGLGRIIGAPGYRAHRSVAMALRVLGLVGIIFAAKFEKW